MLSLQIENARRLVDERLQYLATYDWVHDIQITKFFVHRWWEKIPDEVGLYRRNVLRCM